MKVLACGVCHTELDEIEGRTAPPKLPVVPGHEIVGQVADLGPGSDKHRVGERVGIGWIHSSSGAPDEKFCSDEFEATGRDVNGGYAEYLTVRENYAYPIPEIFSDAQAAPLLCPGAIGYRALKLTNLRNGQRLGLTGFGGSAHLVLQLVRHQFPDTEVYVFARDRTSREFALSLGATWAGETTERSPQRLHAIIDTTPAWRPVVEALENLRPGGRLVINAIRKEDADKDALLDSQLPPASVDGARDQNRGQHHGGRHRRVFAAGRRDSACFRDRHLPAGRGQPRAVALKRQPVQGAKVLIIG